MYEMMSGMINNIFFIIFPILIYQLFAIRGRKHFFSSHKVMLTFLFSGSILLCMLFPYQFVTEEYRFDLRQVPMIVGALYGGPVVSAVLFGVSAAGRIYMGGDGMYIALLNQFLIALILPMLRPAYMRMNRFAKVAFVFLVSILSLLFNLFAGNLLFGDPIQYLLGIWIMLMFNQGAIISLAALLIEQVQRQEYLMNSLVKHEKLETVSHFAASVSHELRNPLQSIKGFIQLMQSYEYDRDKQLEFHDTILREIESAERLIEDYLIFAKPTYGQVEEINVKQEMEQISAVMGPYASHYDVVLRNTHLDGSAFIAADRQKFRQALINIIRNGIEAMPEGGTVSIAVKNTGENVVIELTDEGIGMTKEEIQRLGEPYFSTKTKGTGLGLMVAYSIIRQMNGDIEVTSEKGKGSTFVLHFPGLYII